MEINFKTLKCFKKVQTTLRLENKIISSPEFILLSLCAWESLINFLDVINKYRMEVTGMFSVFIAFLSIMQQESEQSHAKIALNF